MLTTLLKRCGICSWVVVMMVVMMLLLWHRATR